MWITSMLCELVQHEWAGFGKTKLINGTSPKVKIRNDLNETSLKHQYYHKHTHTQRNERNIETNDDGFTWSAHTRMRRTLYALVQPICNGWMAKRKPSLRKVQILDGKHQTGKRRRVNEKPANKLDEIGFMKCHEKNFVILSDILQWISNSLTTLSASILGRNWRNGLAEWSEMKKKKNYVEHIENAWIRWTIT